MSISLFRFLPAAALILAGIAVMTIGTAGIFRIRYVLNRLHAAAMGDSLGLLLIALGLAVLNGFSFASVKVLLIVAIFWMASPVCAHLLSALEAATNDKLSEQCELLPLSALEGKAEEGGLDE